MIGVILVSIGTFFAEISDSIGKNKVIHHKESPFIMAFLTLFWGTILFTLISIFKNNGFIFKSASLPTFSIKVILEIIQVYVSVLAIIKADRSTFSFVRTITIPLLLLVDIVLGYKIGFLSVIGVLVIMTSLLLLFLNKGIKKKGIGLVIFSAVNAVITISLFKYNITHFNSIAAEQLMSHLILLIFFSFLAMVKTKKNPFVFLKKPIFSLQSAAMGLGGVIVSFGYNYGAASIMTAASRSSSIFWALLSGKVYFKEKNIVLKLTIFLLLVIGLVLLSSSGTT